LATDPKVSIVILNWNGCDDTIECLESLKKIDYSNYDVIIVDNASSGDDVAVLHARFGDYIHSIVNERNEGFAGGCNIGMRYALERGADYILLLNNDTVVDAGFLTEMVRVAEGDSKIGITGCKIYYYSQPGLLQSVGGKVNWWLGITTMCGRDEEDKGQYDDLLERDFVFGTALLLKRSVINKIGLLDASFFFECEDIDYCTRAKRAGCKIKYVPASKIWHKYGASSSKLPRFSETRTIVKSNRGIANYKYYYRLFRAYGPPGLYILPFLIQTVSTTLPGEFVRLVIIGDWRRIKTGILKRLCK